LREGKGTRKIKSFSDEAVCPLINYFYAYMSEVFLMKWTKRFGSADNCSNETHSWAHVISNLEIDQFGKCLRLIEQYSMHLNKLVSPDSFFNFCSFELETFEKQLLEKNKTLHENSVRNNFSQHYKIVRHEINKRKKNGELVADICMDIIRNKNIDIYKAMSNIVKK